MRAGAGVQIDEATAVALVERVRQGDQEALGELYRCYQPTVRGYLGVRLSGYPDDVEDLVQETFLLAVELADTFNPEASTVRRWLCRYVAGTLAVTDFFRTHRHGQLSAVAIAVDTLRRGPVQSAESRESRPVSVQVVTALARLTPGQRRAVQLRYLDGLSSAAAAEVAGVSAATVGSHCLSARRRLRAALADLEPPTRSWLDEVPKKTAVKAAFAAVGPDAHQALAWLRERGIRVNTSYAYLLAKQARAGQQGVDAHTSTLAVAPEPRPAADHTTDGVAA